MAPKKKKKDWGEDTRGTKAKQQKEMARKGANKRQQKKEEEERRKQEEKERWEALKKQQKEDEERELDRLKKAKSAKGKEGRPNAGGISRAALAASGSASTSASADSGTPLRGKDKVAAKREKAVEAAGDELAIAESASNVVWASGLDEALGALTTGDGPGSGGGAAVDRHPERRAKAAYRAFEEREMPRIKEEFPHMRYQQRKNKLFKMWKKSPENPMNQDNPAYNFKVGGKSTASSGDH